jgi:DNA-binding NarL/FixJ family response regulator
MALLEGGTAGYLLKNISGNELAKVTRAVYAGEAVLQALRKGWLGLDDLA